MQSHNLNHNHNHNLNTTSVPFEFTWVIGDRHNIHNLKKVSAVTYKTVMHIDNEERTFKELFSRYANNEIPEGFWRGWRLIRAGKEIPWSTTATSQSCSLYLVRRIGHWSTLRLKDNPLIYFSDKQWKEK